MLRTMFPRTTPASAAVQVLFFFCVSCYAFFVSLFPAKFLLTVKESPDRDDTSACTNAYADTEEYYDQIVHQVL